MSTRKKIQRVEVITGSPSMNPPHLITKEEMNELRAMALAALENKCGAPRSIQPVNEKPKSEARQELDNRLQGILERWKDVSPAPILPLTQPGVPCHGATVAAEPEIPLHQLLKDLMRKATRK
jgi:hypothetical protein